MIYANLLVITETTPKSWLSYRDSHEPVRKIRTKIYRVCSLLGNMDRLKASESGGRISSMKQQQAIVSVDWTVFVLHKAKMLNFVKVSSISIVHLCSAFNSATECLILLERYNLCVCY